MVYWLHEYSHSALVQLRLSTLLTHCSKLSKESSKTKLTGSGFVEAEIIPLKYALL